VELASRVGTTVLRARLSDRVPVGVVYTTFHHPVSGANVVTTEHSDWATNCPEYKVTAVQVRAKVVLEDGTWSNGSVGSTGEFAPAVETDDGNGHGRRRRREAVPVGASSLASPAASAPASPFASPGGG
jgi:hypothetical protein